MGHLKLNRELLHIKGDGRDQIFPPTSAKLGHRMRSTGRWLDRFLKMVGAAFSGAPTLEVALTSAVVAGACPTGDKLAWEALAQWLDGGGAPWQWRLCFGVSRGQQGTVYIGEKCGLIWRDSKENFILNLIISSMIIGRIHKGIHISLLRSITLL
jgi:hypothetical protein